MQFAIWCIHIVYLCPWHPPSCRAPRPNTWQPRHSRGSRGDSTPSTWCGSRDTRSPRPSQRSTSRSVNTTVVLDDIVVCPAEGCDCAHRSAGNALFCQAHTFILWHLLQSVAKLSFVCLICRNFTPNKFLSWNIISCNFIYNANTVIGFLNRGSFIVHPLLPGRSKAFMLSVFLPGTRRYVVIQHNFIAFCWGRYRQHIISSEPEGC